MKKFTAVFLIVTICFAFFGCRADEAVQTDTPPSISAQSSSEVIVAESSAQEESTAVSAESGNAAASSSQSAPAQNADAGNTGGNHDSAPEQNNTSQAQPATERQTQAAAKQTQTTAATTSSTVTCTVTIECTAVLEHMESLKAGHEEFVPDDGYIISSCCVTVPNGSSAYDAVKSACEENHITMNTVNSGYGKYIAGFQNIDEKDCGNQSGWLYFVNGKSPSKSCNKYVISNGDSVVFSYTC